MSDPLSVAGSVVGIISLGLQVTQSLYNYYAAVNAQYSDVAHTVRKLESLLEILNCIQTHLDGRKVKVNGTHVLKSIESAIEQCEECVQELQEESRKFERAPADGIRTAIRATGRRLAYPFRQSTLQKLDEDVDELVTHLSLALQLLQQDVTDRVQDEVRDTKAVLDLVRASQLSYEIHLWLKAPDSSIDFNDACKKKHPGTGLWLVKSSSFISWLERPRSFLWLKGFAGCGKSVLSSTAVQHAFRHRRSSPKVGVAFFSFKFSDEGKQDTSAMVRALLLQMSSQLGSTNTALVRLYERHRTATPPDQALLECLRQLVHHFQNVYIVIDALDESPREKHRDAMLQALDEIRAWSEPGLHLLVTSRDEVDIRDALEAMPEEVVVMKNDGIDKDIASFVSQHLRDSRRLRKWHEHHGRIEQVLIEKANGVFRWVKCQLKALADCPKSEHLLEQRLQSLPRTLDETYERMLRNIPTESKEYARQMLAILCCALQPLTVPELVDAIAVEVGATARFNPKRKLGNADDLQQLCPSFTEIHVQHFSKEVTVRIAHFSVQEYLESERIHAHKDSSFFSVQKREANGLMAVVCLTMLLEPQIYTMESSAVSDQYPLAHYAAAYWPRHYRKCAQESLAESQAVRLFLDEAAFQAWVTRYNVELPDVRLVRKGKRTPHTLYHASLLRLDSTLRVLLQDNERHGSQTVRDRSLSYNLNVVGGNRGTAIGAAAYQGHQHVVQLLLANGADLAIADQNGRAPIHEASDQGHVEMVRFLLEKGADFSIADEYGMTPMHVASEKGHIEVVKLLLEKGANANIRDNDGRTAIYRATFEGHIKVIELLLEKGADATAVGKLGLTPMHQASARGHIEVVKLLLQTPGVNVNSRDMYSRTPLFLASMSGRHAVVRLLLDDGRTSSALADWYGATPLFAAVRNCHLKAAEMLLAREPSGVGTQAQDGFGRTLRWWARRTGNLEIAGLLGEDADRLDDPVPETDPIRKRPVTDYHGPRCDACTRPFLIGWWCGEGDTDLCDECHDLGIGCPDETHESSAWGRGSPYQRWRAAYESIAK